MIYVFTQMCAVLWTLHCQKMSAGKRVLYPADMLLSLQVCLKVQHRWFVPERGAPQS